MNRRNTKQRQLVAEAVRALEHPSAEEIYAAVSRENPNIGKATVYRNLNLLAEQGEIGKVPRCRPCTPLHRCWATRADSWWKIIS